MLCLLIPLFVQFTNAEKPSIVGRWTALYSKEKIFNILRKDKEQVEFFANGKYLWVSDYDSGVMVQRGAYTYKDGLLICYNTDKRTLFINNDLKKGNIYCKFSLRFLSKNTIECKSETLDAVYERINQ